MQGLKLSIQIRLVLSLRMCEELWVLYHIRLHGAVLIKFRDKSDFSFFLYLYFL